MSFTTNDDSNDRLADVVGKDHVRELEQRGSLAAQIISKMTHQEINYSK